MVITTIRPIFFLSLFLVSSTVAASLSDTLFIEGYYSQLGKNYSRRTIENFLLSQDTSMALADAAKGLRLSAWAIGATMWCINTGIAIYQIKQFMDAVERQEPISSNLDNLTIPLAIGYLDPGPVDTRARDTQLSLGIGFTSFGILNAIIGTITRTAAIKEYNASLEPLKPQACASVH
jgi:hypothetical protein